MTALWSLNEVAALALKAARGGGYDWGMAEESGQAVRWLLTRGLPGADALAMACQKGVAKTPESCPVTIGCAMSDGLADAFVPRSVAAPLLLLPFVAWTAIRRKTALNLRWPGAQFMVSATGELALSGENFLPSRADVIVDETSCENVALAAIRHRAEVSCETYMALTTLAGKTYAPSTEASRESGAGAGLTDND